MGTRASLLPLACAVALVAVTSARSVESGPAESTATLTDMRLMHVLLEVFAAEHGSLPVTRGAFRPVASIDPLRRGFYGERCPARDAWGNDLLFWSDGRHYLLLSAGRDGRLDQEYDPSRMYERGFLSSAVPDDIVLRDGQIAQLPPDPPSSTRRTLAAIVELARTIEDFRRTHGVYPGPTPGLVAGESVGEPAGGGEAADPGGAAGARPALLLRTAASGYLIVSPGDDGTLDQDYGGPDFPPPILDPGPTASAAADIVLLNGRFVKWPRGAPGIARRTEGDRAGSR